MKRIVFLIFLFLISCGKRCVLEPYEKDHTPYPGQYPKPDKNAPTYQKSQAI
jgi:hypothetical protein